MKKKFFIITIVLLSFIPLAKLYGQAFFYARGPLYACTSNLGGFNLIPQPGGYRLKGPIYVPVPGYSAALSDIAVGPGQPADAVGTLTLTPPPDTIRKPPLAVVPPLWIDVSFPTAGPLRRLTIDIVHPVNSFDKQITCQMTGATP